MTILVDCCCYEPVAVGWGQEPVAVGLGQEHVACTLAGDRNLVLLAGVGIVDPFHAAELVITDFQNTIKFAYFKISTTSDV